MRRTRPGVRLRVLALLGLVVGGFAVYLAFTKRVPFVDGYRVEAVVPSSNQLRDGSPVRIAGVEVGQVLERRPGPGDNATLVLQIADEGRPIRADASLKIRPRLFLEGGFYVELRPGSPSAPELRDGGRIPLRRTAIPVQLSQVLSTLTGDMRKSLVDVLDRLATGADRGGAVAFGRAARPLGSVARDGAIVAEAARGSERGDLTRLVQGSARVTSALASRNAELSSLVTDLRRTTDALARRDDELSATVRGVDATLRAAPPALRSLDAMLPPTRRFVAAVRPSLRLAPPILRDGNATLKQLGGLVGPAELPRLVSGLDPTIREAPQLVDRLVTLFDLVTPVTDCVRERALPVLYGTVDDGALSTGQPIWLELLHGATGALSAAQNFDGNGLGGRLEGGFGEQIVRTGVGGVDGLGPLLGRVSGSKKTFIGSRPVPLPPGTRTPFRPDATCREQPKVDLRARRGPLMVGTQSDPGTPTLTPLGDVLDLLKDVGGLPSALADPGLRLSERRP